MFLSNTYRVQAMIIEANESIRHRRVIITVYITCNVNRNDNNSDSNKIEYVTTYYVELH